MPVTETMRSQMPPPSVRILRKKRHYELTNAVPVRNSDKLRLSVQVPAGLHAVLLLLGSDGELRQVANAAASGSPQLMAFPEKADEVAPVTGAPGTEVVLAIGFRSEPPDLAVLKSLLADGTAWPALPADSVLRLTPTEVAVDQTSRNLGDPET